MPEEVHRQSHPAQPHQPARTTSSLAIIGFVLAFVVPLAGLILSIVALTQVKKQHQKGEGLAIAGIVISAVWGVLGIMLLLVVATFTGVQQKARDTERQNDISILINATEAYFAQHNYYPTRDNLNDSSWRAANMSNVATDAFQDPRGTDGLAATPMVNAYSYVAEPAGCNNTTVKCTSYTFTAKLESGETYTKKSLL